MSIDDPTKARTGQPSSILFVADQQSPLSGENRNPPQRQNTPRDRLLRLREIIGPGGIIPLSRSAWWLGVQQGRFPAPVRLGPRSVAWRESDILKIVSNGVR